MRPRLVTVWIMAAGMVIGSGCSMGSRKVLVIAHRGDSATYPENTLVAFRSAADKGADLVELDTRATADGVLVVLHDDTLDRTTNSVTVLKKEKQPVSAYEYSLVKKLDAGSWKSPAFKGQRIPTLAEAAEVINARSQMLLERKAGTAMAHAKYLRSSGQIDRIVVQSFDWDFVAAIHTLVPEARVAALGGGDITEEVVADLCMTGAKIAVWRQKDLNAASMKLLRDAGLAVWSFTIDEPKEWERLCALGVEGIITNKPAECLAWLEERQGK